MEKNVNNIKNPHLKHLFILCKIKQEISDCCLEGYGLKIAPFQDKRIKERSKRIKKLKEMGLKAKDKDMSFYLNSISPACHYCKKGFGPTVSLTDACNRDCFFCFLLKPQRVKEPYHILSNIDADRTIQFLKNSIFPRNIINLGISGGEPLLISVKALEAIKTVKQRKKTKSITRLYTNGDLLNEDILKKLKQAGLDEIRFGIKPGESWGIDKIVIAKKYIPRVLMEGPVFPESEKFMKKILTELNKLKIFGINLLDLRCRYNIPIYKKSGYLFDHKEKRPFYEEWENQGWPIYGSEETIFNLLEFAIQKKLSFSVHYCPFRQNINVSYLNMRRMRAFANKRHHETVTEEGLLRKIVLYFPDYLKGLSDLRKQGVPEQEIHISFENKRLETHIRNLRHLDLTKYEIGVLDTLPDGREVNIEIIKTKPYYNRLIKDKNKAESGIPYLTIIGEHIADIYFRKKSERNDNALKVLDILRKGLKILPGSSAIYLASSYILYSIRRYRQAIKIISKIIEKGYQEAGMYVLLGCCYGSLKQYKKAIKELKKAEKMRPKDTRINFILEKYYGKLSQLDKSKGGEAEAC